MAGRICEVREREFRRGRSTARRKAKGCDRFAALADASRLTGRSYRGALIRTAMLRHLRYITYELSGQGVELAGMMALSQVDPF